MKRVYLVLALLGLVVCLYWLPDGVNRLFAHPRLQPLRPDAGAVQRFFDMLGVLVGLMIVLEITYRRWWSGRVFKSLPRTLLWAGCLTLLAISGSWVYTVVRRMDAVYRFYKSGVGIEGFVFAADARLGHRGIPYATGAHVYRSLDKTLKRIPIQLDSLGFRTTSTPYPSHRADSLALFLGCSFTWGDYVAAEQTYPAYVAQGFHVRYLNTGTSAYGLAQMLQLAEELIPEKCPEVVFVQFSPWLADRARFVFFPMALGVMPYPYLCEGPNGPALQTPLFLSASYSQDSDFFKNSQPSLRDKLAFVRSIGLPMVAVDGLKHIWAEGKIKLGLIPRPVPDNARVERFVYHRIAELCRQCGSRLVVVNLGMFSDKSDRETRLRERYDRAWFGEVFDTQKYPQTTFVDADSALRAALHRSADYTQYVLWDKAGKDSVVFDLHPNPLAHRRIAETILTTLRP